MYIELTEEQISAVLAEEGTISAAMLRRIIAPAIEFLQSAGGKETLTSLLSYDHILEGIIPEWVAFKKTQVASPTTSTEPEWVTWTGGACPVGRSTMVVVRLRDGNEAMSPAGIWRWRNSDYEPLTDIVAYRVVEPASAPAEPEWIPHDGGARPAFKRAEIRFRGGSTCMTTNVSECYWYHDGQGGDIVAYRIIEAAEPEWIDWAGGECPVDKDTKVLVRFNDGDESTRPQHANFWRWEHVGGDVDIVAYRVIEA